MNLNIEIIVRSEQENYETETIKAFLRWQNVNYSVVFDAGRNLKLSHGHGGPVIWIGSHNVCIEGFHNLFKWFNENGLCLC